MREGAEMIRKNLYILEKFFYILDCDRVEAPF
jgi:hypothetical protein